METKQTRKRYLLTLYRQGSDLNHATKDHVYVTHKEGEESFFSTDYFNKLVVEEIKLQKEDNNYEDMASFIGMKNRNYPASEVIAVHNYAIFQDINCSEECDVDNLFKNDTSYPYLGLIFVYVTPDVLAGLNSQFQNHSYINYFEEDLKQMVKICNELIEVKGQVFKMLSASDFMIAIRSKSLEDIYSVSMAIRKRMICKKDMSEECLSAYKTYTILTINGWEMEMELKSDTSKHFAIRGKYSNSYWKNRDIWEQNITRPEGYTNLAGRYDFLIHLNVNEFWYIYPYLCQVKKIATINVDLKSHFLDLEKQSDAVQYLVGLLKKGYLSYLNERYLMGESVDISSEFKKKYYPNTEFNFNILTNISLNSDTDTKEFMFEKIEQECEDIIEEISKVKEEFKKEKWSRTSILSSMDLLNNLVYLCQHVNGLSDARMYVISLLRQIRVVLLSLVRWKEMYKNAIDIKITDDMEDYLRKSIVSLETYGSLIRNNNFQTLQAPTYNVVTGISIEKILIGYTHFLGEVMHFYGNKLLGEDRDKYLPIMIPTLGQTSLDIEVLFPKYREDKFKSVESEKQEYLMVVNSPATDELVDMSIIITTLFHELAHRLRYEERRVRNEVIFQMMLEDLAQVLIDNFFTIVVEPTNGLANTLEMQVLFFDILVGVMKGKMKEFIEPYMELPLEDFKVVAQEKLQEFLELIQEEDQELIRLMHSFIEDTNEYITNDENVMDVLIDMSKDLKLLTGKEKNSRLEKMENAEEVIKEDLLRNIKLYIDICANNLESLDETEDKEQYKKSLEHLAEMLAICINEYKSSNKKEGYKEGFYNEFFYEICKEWNNGIKKKEKSKIQILPQKKIWLKQGRQLGIDFPLKDNQDKFQKNFEKALKISNQYEFENAMKHIALYREETSDLFMCSVCELNLLDYLVIGAKMYPFEDGTYEDGYLDRMIDVILIQWCLEKAEDINTICSDTFSKEGIFREVWEKLNPNSKGGFNKISDMLNAMDEYIEDEENSLLKRKVAILLKQVLEKIDARIYWFKKRAYLVKDYMRGKEKYGEVKKQFENSWKSTSSINMRDIINVCKEVLESMGNVDISLRQSYQKKYETFIWEGYYSDKIQHTMELEKMQQERETKKNGN